MKLIGCNQRKVSSWFHHVQALFTVPLYSGQHWKYNGCSNEYENTLFSGCFAHENHPNFLKFLGHGPRPRVTLILSNGLESNKVFFILLPRPFDKLIMTRSQGP